MKEFAMISQVFRLITTATFAFVIIALMPTDCWSQTDAGTDFGGPDFADGDIGGGDIGGGDIGGGDIGGGDLGGGDIGGDLSSGTGQGASAGRLPNLGNIFDLEADIPVIEDERRKGFVGPTSDLGRAVDESVPATGFVGPTSELFEEGGAAGSGAGRTGGAGGPGAPGPGTGEQNGFVVTRQGIRSRVRPAFRRAFPVDGNFVSTRFANRMRLQPSTRAYGENVRVNVQNRTAVLSGFVRSREEADRIIRQLRLEPGVYRIDNRMSIGN